MRKNLRLLFATALCMLGVGQTYAQSVPDPLVNLKWGEAGAITDEGTFGGITGFTTYTNSGYNYRRRCPVPTSIYDSVKKTYIGSKDNGWGDSFYVKFNEGDDLANSFLNKFSIEFLYSPQYADAYTANREGKYIFERDNQYWRSPMGCWNGWGWFFNGHDATYNNCENSNLRFVIAATNKNSYTVGDKEHTPGYDQISIPCYSMTPQVPGKFYHVVATVDYNDTKMINLYIDGVKVGETDIPDTVMSKLPALGAVNSETNLRENMFLLLGATPNGYYPKDITNGLHYFYNSSANEYVSTRIYNDALTEEQVKSLYDNDDVKYYTEQNADLDKDMLMDVHFANGGNATDESSLKADIVKVGTGADAVSYDATQKRNVAKFTDEDFKIGDNDADAKYTQNFYYRDFNIDPKFKSHLSDGFSIEVYSKLSNATPDHAMVPVGNLNYENAATGANPSFAPNSGNYKEFGTGYMISTTGRIGFNLNTIGWHDEGENSAWAVHNYTSTLKANDWVGYSSDAGVASTEWQHVVMVYDRVNGYWGIYVNGQPVTEGELSPTEYLRYCSAAWQYFGIGADADYVNLPHTYGEWAFDGDMSICRIWSKSLDYDNVQSLYEEAQKPGTTVTLDNKGYATLCVPYNFTIPTGLTAYVISAQDASTVTLTKFLGEGGKVAYGTPVILSGKANTQFTITASSDDNAVKPTVNLLYGTFATKYVPAKYVYEVNSANEKMEMNSADKTLKAHTAYLPVGTSTADSKAFGTPTGISITDVQPIKNVDNVYYDLSGRRINKPSKGLYLQKGKKVLVK